MIEKIHKFIRMKNTKEKTDSEYVLKKFAWFSLIYINTTDSNDDHKYGQIKRIHIAKIHVYVYIHTVRVLHVRHLHWSVLYLSTYALRSQCTGCSSLAIPDVHVVTQQGRSNTRGGGGGG